MLACAGKNSLILKGFKSSSCAGTLVYTERGRAAASSGVPTCFEDNGEPLSGNECTEGFAPAPKPLLIQYCVYCMLALWRLLHVWPERYSASCAPTLL